MDDSSNEIEKETKDHTYKRSKTSNTDIKEILSIEYCKILNICDLMTERINTLESQVGLEQETLYQAIEEARVFTNITKHEVEDKMSMFNEEDVSEIRNKYQKLSDPQNYLNSEDKQTSFSKLRFLISNFLFYTMLIVAIVVAFLFTSNQNESGPPRSILGYAPLTVLTKSMQSEIPKDSLVIIKETDPNTIKVGDDITFILENNSTITHRVIGIYENYEGTNHRGFETQGVDNPRPDKDVVYAQNVVGKVVFHNLGIGRVLLFIKKNIVIVFVLCVLTIWFLYALKNYWTIRKQEKTT